MTNNYKFLPKYQVAPTILYGVINALKRRGVKAWADDCWLDQGAGLAWETILATSQFGDYQVLCPTEQIALVKLHSVASQLDEVDFDELARLIVNHDVTGVISLVNSMVDTLAA